ncbi:MAG: hypothetical protein LBT48_04150 [Prevotellaceae bacterium]|jgi:hypothetical protein|nr:hypothetical protein [Prevotellaceae bacterium]
MKTTKLLSMALISLLTVAAVISCKKDEDETNEEIPTAPASPFDGRLSGTILTLYLTMLDYGEIDALESGGYSPATCPVSENGTFELLLPTPTVNELRFLNAGAPKTFRVNPDNAKGFIVGYLDAKKDGEYIGEVYLYTRRALSQQEAVITIISWIYVDIDVTISGTDGENSYNLNLKQGWNIYKEAATVNSQEEEVSGATISTGNIPTDVTWVFINTSDMDTNYAGSISAKASRLFLKK